MTDQFSSEVTTTFELVHQEWIEEREREQQLRDEKFVNRFLAAKLRAVSKTLDSSEA